AEYATDDCRSPGNGQTVVERGQDFRAGKDTRLPISAGPIVEINIGNSEYARLPQQGGLKHDQQRSKGRHEEDAPGNRRRCNARKWGEARRFAAPALATHRDEFLPVAN